MSTLLLGGLIKVLNNFKEGKKHFKHDDGV